MRESVLIRITKKENTDNVILKQEEYSIGTGKITQIDIINAIYDYFFATDTFDVDCGVEDGVVKTIVLAYPSREDLIFDFGVTNGEITSIVKSTPTVNETINFKGDSESTVSLPIHEFDSVEWLTDPYNMDGEQVGMATPSRSGDTFKTAENIWGSAEVTYQTTVYSHYIELTALDTVDNVFESTAWTRWDGGGKLLEITEPDGATEDYLNDVSCIYGSIVNIEPPPDDPVPPKAYPEDEIKYIDYCTQEETGPES